MRRARNHKALALWAIAIASTLACFALGLKMASAQKPPPPCPAVCPCRNLNFWQPPGGSMYGAFVHNGQPATITVGMPNVNTAAGCNIPPLHGTVNYDRWVIANGALNCTPPNGSLFVTELNVNQVGVVPRTQQNFPNGQVCN